MAPVEPLPAVMPDAVLPASEVPRAPEPPPEGTLPPLNQVPAPSGGDHGAEAGVSSPEGARNSAPAVETRGEESSPSDAATRVPPTPEACADSYVSALEYLDAALKAWGRGVGATPPGITQETRDGTRSAGGRLVLRFVATKADPDAVVVATALVVALTANLVVLAPATVRTLRGENERADERRNSNGRTETPAQPGTVEKRSFLAQS